MEKRKPTYDLNEVKAAVRRGRVRMTLTARRTAHALGASDGTVWDVVLDLSRADFYKSMTSYADHTVWQDVYHARWGGLVIYVKLQIDGDGYLLLSFKER